MSGTLYGAVLLQSGTLLAALLLGFAALKDIAVRIIPDIVPFGVLAVGLILRSSGGDLVPAAIASAATFLVAGLCWRYGWLGGGDVKLLAASVWLVRPPLVPELVLTIAVAGGLLALLYLSLHWLTRGRSAWVPVRPRSVVRRVWQVERWRIRRGGSLPYGCAIAVGALLTMTDG